MKDIVKLEAYSEQWEILADAIARDIAPTIYPCAHCNYPVVSGYCCSNCGSSNPDGK